MDNLIKVAVLGCTGYTGLELVYILSKHPRISINYLGSESHSGKSINLFDERLNKEFIGIKIPFNLYSKKFVLTSY